MRHSAWLFWLFVPFRLLPVVRCPGFDKKIPPLKKGVRGIHTQAWMLSTPRLYYIEPLSFEMLFFSFLLYSSMSKSPYPLFQRGVNQKRLFFSQYSNDPQHRKTCQGSKRAQSLFYHNKTGFYQYKKPAACNWPLICVWLLQGPVSMMA